MQFLGIDNDFSLSNPLNRLLVLAAVYVPLDGMNEKGLCISINAIEHSRQTNQNTDKPDLTTTAAVRLLLDYAASVEEAVSLLAQYDLHASANVDYHFAISDARGNSVVVEYINNMMVVLETPVVTNHFLVPGSYYKVGLPANDRRYELLMNYFNKKQGILSHEDVKEALAAVAQNDEIQTQWSIIYDQTNFELAFYHKQNFDKP